MLEEFMYIVKKLSDNSKEYLNTYYDIVDNLNQAFTSVEPSNSISGTFINQFVTMLNSGIQMNDNILKYTTNTDVENLAKNISEDATGEIDRLNQMLENCACVCNGEKEIKIYIRKSNEIFNNLITRLNSVANSNNLDALYLTSMITHHENSILLAKNVLSFSICGELKEILSDILDEYALQLSSMRGLLKNMI